MASKKNDGPLRGAALIKKAIEVAKTASLIDSPEPVAASVLKKLRLPNEEKISPAMKELLAFDSSFLGWSIDDEEPELETMSLDELIEAEIGAESVSLFGEAIEMLSEDCVLIGESDDVKRFLYVGTADDKGEYPVITVAADGSPWVGGFVPFDVWVAQHLGALEAEKTRGWVPPEYEVFCKALAESNGDGRVSFTSETRDIAAQGDDEEEEEDDSAEA